MSLLTSQAWSKILNITGWKKKLPESEMNENKSKHLIVSSLAIIIATHLRDSGNNKKVARAWLYDHMSIWILCFRHLKYRLWYSSVRIYFMFFIHYINYTSWWYYDLLFQQRLSQMIEGEMFHGLYIAVSSECRGKLLHVYLFILYFMNHAVSMKIIVVFSLNYKYYLLYSI